MLKSMVISTIHTKNEQWAPKQQTAWPVVLSSHCGSSSTRLLTLTEWVVGDYWLVTTLLDADAALEYWSSRVNLKLGKVSCRKIVHDLNLTFAIKTAQESLARSDHNYDDQQAKKFYLNH